MSAPRINAIDHLVLNVADIETSCEFYVRVLGATAITFGDNRRALQIGAQKINLHPPVHRYSPVAHHPHRGSADLCFLTDTSLALWQTHLEAQGVAILLGPVARTGAMGPLTSLYLHDPDGNLIEIANQTKPTEDRA